MHATSPDLYRPSHVALRRELAGFIAAIGEADEAVWSRAEEAWNRFADIIEAQGEAEAACLQPMLRIADPQAADRLDRQHGQIEKRVAEITRVLATRRAATDAARRDAAGEVFRCLSALLSDCRIHQADEDRTAIALADRFHPMALYAAERAMRSSEAARPAQFIGARIERPKARHENVTLADMASNACASAFFSRAERKVEAALRAASRKPHACEPHHRRRNRVRVV